MEPRCAVTWREGWPKEQEERCPHSRLEPMVNNIHSVPTAFEKILEMMFHATHGVCLTQVVLEACYCLGGNQYTCQSSIIRGRFPTSTCTWRSAACLKEVHMLLWGKKAVWLQSSSAGEQPPFKKSLTWKLNSTAEAVNRWTRGDLSKLSVI